MRIKNIANIAQGATFKILSELGYPNSYVETLAALRKQICDRCEMKGRDPIKGEICNDCGCKLEWKRRSDSNCPRNKWDKI